MDVGDPNNFARILHLYGQDREALRVDVEGQRVSDEETLETLKRFDRGSFDRDSYLGGQGYLADPHTAVGLCALEKALAKKADGTIGIVLATAHPAKFAEAVESTLGRQLPLPEALARHMGRKVLAEDLPNDYEALKKPCWPELTFSSRCSRFWCGPSARGGGF